MKASYLLQPRQWVPAFAAGTTSVPEWGAVVVTKCQWAAGIRWMLLGGDKMSVSEYVPPEWTLPLGPRVKDEKYVKFCEGLKKEMFGTMSPAGLNFTFTEGSVTCMFLFCVHVSYTCAEVLAISWCVNTTNYYIAEELPDLVFLAAKVLFTLQIKKR